MIFKYGFNLINRCEEFIDLVKKGYSPDSIWQNNSLQDKERLFALLADEDSSNPAILYLIANCYESNFYGTSSNFEKAVELYNMLVNQSYEPAIYRLGEMYYNGIHFKSSYKNALKYYQLCESFKYIPSYDRLGQMYAMGYGVDQNYQTSNNYLLKAIDAKYYQSSLRLARNYLSNNEPQLAIKILESAANEGFYYAMNELGNLYRYGEVGIDIDYNKAMDWYQKSLASGYEKIKDIICEFEEEISFTSVCLNACEDEEEKIYNEAYELYSNNKITIEVIDRLKTIQSSIKDRAYYLVALCYYYAVGVQNDYEQYCLWRDKAVELNNMDAYFALGQDLVIDGDDMPAALAAFEKAKALGHKNVDKEIATLYMCGNGIPKDIEKGMEHIKMALQSQDFNAYIYLGQFYENGIGFERNLKKAFENYQWARNMKVPEGIFHVGRCYFEGVGVLKDEVEGIYIMQQAASLGYEKASTYLKDIWVFMDPKYEGYLYLFKEAVVAETSNNGEMLYHVANALFSGIYGDYCIAKDVNRGMKFLYKSAYLEDKNAMYDLAIRAFNGAGLEKDIERGYDLIYKAALKHQPQALTYMGYLYENGIKYPKDEKQALAYYQQAYQLGDKACYMGLGKMYFDGILLEKNHPLALEMLQQVNSDSSILDYCLGALYYQGEGVKHDYIKAVKHLKNASTKGNIEARLLLGDCFYHGRGVSKNYDNAYQCYKIAANANHPRGIKCVKVFEEQQCLYCKKFFTLRDKKTIFGMKKYCANCEKILK